MKSLRNYLILFFALTTIGGAGLAWRQYAELVELRAIAMNREERADFNQRIWELEKTNRDLRDRLAAAEGDARGEFDRLVAEATGEQSENDSGRMGRGRRGWPMPQMGAIRDLMGKPEVQRMLSAQQKARIEQNYAALFRNLNLSPDQAERLKTLLAERLSTRQDIMTAAHAEGINPRDNPEAFRKLLSDARDQIDSSIKSVIGDGGFAQLQNYEQTLPQRSIVNDLQQRLSYSDTPLTAAQADQLVQILASTAPAGQTGANAVPGQSPPGVVIRGGFGDLGMAAGVLGGGGGPGSGFLGMVVDGSRSLGSATITPAAVNQAQAVLSQPQVSVLQQMQQQQQDQQQLARIIRETVSSGGSDASSTSGQPRRSGGG